MSNVTPEASHGRFRTGNARENVQNGRSWLPNYNIYKASSHRRPRENRGDRAIAPVVRATAPAFTVIDETGYTCLHGSGRRGQDAHAPDSPRRVATCRVQTKQQRPRVAAVVFPAATDRNAVTAAASCSDTAAARPGIRCPCRCAVPWPGRRTRPWTGRTPA